MEHSNSLLKPMCRACLCRNLNFHSIYDEAEGQTFTICDMFATTLPQIPIHKNDELPKVICTACLNTLITAHKFHEMCTSSDTYMRSLLSSKSLSICDSNKGQQPEGLKHSAVANLDYTHQKEQPMLLGAVKIEKDIEDSLHFAKENPPVLPSAIKIENEDMEDSLHFSKDFSESNSQCYEENQRVLEPYSNLANCMKFESTETELQECDVNNIIFATTSKKYYILNSSVVNKTVKKSPKSNLQRQREYQQRKKEKMMAPEKQRKSNSQCQREFRQRRKERLEMLKKNHGNSIENGDDTQLPKPSKPEDDIQEPDPSQSSNEANEQQLEILLTIMEAKPRAERTFQKGHKRELARFWSMAEYALNSAGPPSKSVSEWKKVWASEEKHMLQKAAQKGSLDKMQKFSEIEETNYEEVPETTAEKQISQIQLPAKEMSRILRSVDKLNDLHKKLCKNEGFERR